MQEYLTSAYVEEYGLNAGIVRPFNAYGPRDDFFRQTNHVIAGLITRVCNGENPLMVWGTGKQTRSFLYVTDFARGLLEACAHEHMRGPVNLGSDEEITIGNLAHLIVELSGKQIDICFDTSKPDGQPRRACDTRKAKEMLGFHAQVPLRVGLAKTIAWYTAERQKRHV
jgi:GDP-L-fucose synthase